MEHACVQESLCVARRAQRPSTLSALDMVRFSGQGLFPTLLGPACGATCTHAAYSVPWGRGVLPGNGRR